MKHTIEIEADELNNSTIFKVTEECTRQNISTKDVDTILVWEGIKLHRFEFVWGLDGKISGLSRKFN